MTGLLIFLGLLGTFWGLLQHDRRGVDVIQHMTIGSSDIAQLFEQLKSGLAQPLNGMGIAFSASLFGLSSALVLGFLDLTAAQAQNRFFNELEEWLAGLTRLSSGVLSEGEGSVPVYVQALLEQTAENMEGLQHILTRGEDSRAQASQAMQTLTERMAALTDTMRASQQLMLRIAETQASLAPALQRLDRPARRCRHGRCLPRASAQHRPPSAAPAGGKRAGPRAEHGGTAQRSAGADPHHRRALAEEQRLDGADTRAATRLRRARDDGVARLRGRAVHAADGHHLRAAGVRAGAGIPVLRADRTQQGAGQGHPEARRGRQDAVARKDARRPRWRATVAQLTGALATSENNRAGPGHARSAGLTTQLGAAQQTAQASGARATDLGTKLADAQQRLADMQRAAQELDQTVQADRATIEAKVSDVAKLDEQVRALGALRDQLEMQAQNAAARAMTEKDRRLAVAAQLAGEQKLGDSAKAQIVLLNQQVDQLKAQLGAVAKALDIEKSSGQEKDVKIANLGQQLNVALAAKVQELQQLSQRVLRHVAQGAGGRTRNPGGRRSLRDAERRAVPAQQRRSVG